MSGLTGCSFIACARGTGLEEAGTGFDPRTGVALAPPYRAATAAEVERAGTMAGQAFPVLARAGGEKRAELLEAIAAGLEEEAGAIVERAMAETALPEARFRSELARTTGQLRMFAAVARDGSWVEPRVDAALPGRQPLPRPEVRSGRRPLGPVAVFCASNFPLAFSVAGGDSAAAWAVGCPVLVYANMAHPGTAELAGAVVAEAVQRTGLPAGTFSLLYGAGHGVGQALVRLPAVTAVAFTGSRRGGLACRSRCSPRWGASTRWCCCRERSRKTARRSPRACWPR
jgi:NADP-dependent aldehyde dehydrogenase